MGSSYTECEVYRTESKHLSRSSHLVHRRPGKVAFHQRPSIIQIESEGEGCFIGAREIHIMEAFHVEK